MIYSLSELSEFVNDIANYLVEKACKETETGSFEISFDDIDPGKVNFCFADEDLYQYGDFIAAELEGRPEFEFVDYHDNTFSGSCKREYCPNLDDKKWDEPTLPISKTLNMQELAEIGQRAIDKLKAAGLPSLRETLGMDFDQIHQLGLAKQDHYFGIGTIHGLNTFWSAEIDQALVKMRHECRIGTNPCLYYCEMTKAGDVMRCPIAREECGKMVSITHDKAHRPDTAEFLAAMGRLEAQVYGLHPYGGYSLSYRVTTEDKFQSMAAVPEEIYPTMQSALDAFQAMSDSEGKVILSVIINDKYDRANDALRLSQENGRTVVHAAPFRDHPIDPCYGNFYPDLVRRVFDGREMHIDNWKVRVIAPGEAYGRSNQLFNDDPASLVEFRDMTSASPETPDGTMLSRVDISFFIGKDGKGGFHSGQSFCVDDATHKWVSAEALAPVLTWLRLKDIEISQEKSAGLEGRIRNAQTRSAEQQSDKNIIVQKDMEH